MKKISVLLSIILVLSCSKNKGIKIVVIGDVQLKSDIKRYNKEAWLNQKLDTTRFSKLFSSVLKKEAPNYIFQTGDWVNYNNNLNLEIKDTLNNSLNYLPMPYNEWKYMSSEIPEELMDKFYIAIGNHESYKNIVLEGIEIPNIDILVNIKETTFNLYNTIVKKELLIEKFPHLENEEFHGDTGSYVVYNENFTLISIDGLDKNRSELLTFIKYHLSKHKKEFSKNKLFVISHYPLFTGRHTSDDAELALKDIRGELIELFDKHKVDLYLNGHEHFYLRYKKQGFKHAGFKEPIPKHTKYITISNFANPYGRTAKRFNLETYNKSDIVYFEGIHYSTIEIIKNKIVFKTKAFKEENWITIDSLNF